MTTKFADRYFLYARKSTESDERQLQSIRNQIERVREFAERADLRIVEIFEESKSASRPGIRPVFDDMMARIANGEASGIVTWKIDRLSRNPIDSGMIQWYLQEGILEHIKTMNRDHLPSDNVLLLYMEVAIANQYIRDLAENVTRGLRSKVKDGWFPGVAPAGYLNTPALEKGARHIIRDPDRFESIKEAWEMLLAGHPQNEILDHLNLNLGYRSLVRKGRGGRPMRGSTLYDIFRNPFYAGMFEYTGELFEGAHEPMISADDFEKAQKILCSPDRPRPQNHRYAYTGILKCGECGSSITATTKVKKLMSTGEEKTYVLYYCNRSRRSKASCSQRQFTNESKIEEAIEALLREVTIPRPIANCYEALIDERIAVEQKRNSAKVDQIRRKIDRTQKQISNLTTLRIQEDIDEENFAKQSKRLKSELTQLRTKLRQSDKQPKEVAQSLRDAFEVALWGLDTLKTGSVDERRALLTRICMNCVLTETVALQSHDWLVPFKKYRWILARKIEVHEPDKQGSVETPNACSDTFESAMCRLSDEVETKIRDSL